MTTKHIITISLTLLFFWLSPCARAQNNDLDDEITKAVEKAVGKAVNEKIEIMKASWQKEIIRQLQSYHLARIESFDPETQTITAIIARHFINGELINDAYVCNKIPVFIPAGSNVTINRGDMCMVFFSGLNRDTNINLVSRRTNAPTPSDALAIVGFVSKQDQERKANEQQMISELAARLGSINSGFAQAPSTAQTTGRIDTARLCKLIIEFNSELIDHFQKTGFSGSTLTLKSIQDELRALQK